ncbi:4Fe-4S dicluster domain-containing protein [Desulfatiglans anilini]|uniref:4Fe-4S dicluster domain-containing protein n=1 Tax=Desulfatiglans anilini TaxID=90728 RepID=UPI000412DC09|nr:4Fe-4S dicluster domain-containing protein [Desulfatiglans anilini]
MRLGLLVDLSRCIGCFACVVGCKNWHGLPAGDMGRMRLVDFTLGAYPDVNRWLVPVSCMHCEHPPCAAVCRFSACSRGEDGIVRVDSERCTGCALCTLACPYGARFVRPDTGKADGCDFCRDRLAEGEAPLCVQACPGECLIFGDLDDEASEIRRRIEATGAESLLKRYRTRPRVFYAGLETLTANLQEDVDVLENAIKGRSSKGPFILGGA